MNCLWSLKYCNHCHFFGGHYVLGLGVMFEHLGFTETFKEREKERKGEQMGKRRN